MMFLVVATAWLSLLLLVATAWLSLFLLFAGKSVPAVEAAIDSDPSWSTTSSVETALRHRSASPWRFGTRDGSQKKGPGSVNTAPKDVRSDPSSSTTSSVETTLRHGSASSWRFGTRDGSQGPGSVNTAPKDVRSDPSSSTTCRFGTRDGIQKKRPWSVNTAPKDVRSGSGSNGARPAGKQDVTRRLRHGTTEKPPPPPPRGSNGARPAGKQEAKGRVKPKGVQMKALLLKVCCGGSQARTEAEELDLEIHDVLMTRPDGTKLRFRKRWWADTDDGIVEVVAEEDEGLVAQSGWRRQPSAGAAARAAREAEELVVAKPKGVQMKGLLLKVSGGGSQARPEAEELDLKARAEARLEAEELDLKARAEADELFDGSLAVQRWWADSYDAIVKQYSIVQSNGHHGNQRICCT